MNGKGSRPRPLAISRHDFAKRWDGTFRRKKPARKPEASETEATRK